MKRIPEEDYARICELAEEFGVSVTVVRSLYDIMPNELYDGIVIALEDLEAEGWQEEI
nr:MAG TPA: Transcriptional regulator, RHH-like, CopG [Caudoviricetes sp.]